MCIRTIAREWERTSELCFIKEVRLFVGDILGSIFHTKEKNHTALGLCEMYFHCIRIYQCVVPAHIDDCKQNMEESLIYFFM